MQKNKQQEEKLKKAKEEEQDAPKEAEQDEAAEAACDGSCADELETLRQEKEEYLAMLRRERADFDNYKKRNAEVYSAAYTDGILEAVKSILPVIDNLERALAVECKDNRLSEGIHMIQRQLLDILSGHGLKEVETEGVLFDPTCMEAVARVEKEEEQSDDAVAEVMQKGYTLKGRLLRCAMVKVAK
jgi:molecular chaperone GrpE